MINQIDQLMLISGIDIAVLPLEYRLKVLYALEQNNILDFFTNGSDELRLHTLGVVNLSAKLFEEYAESIGMANKKVNKVEVQLAALFHDLGKNGILDVGSSYDTLNVEFALRYYHLNSIAQCVRKNPFLFLNDLHKGLTTIGQLILSYADLQVSYNGLVVSINERIKEISNRHPELDVDILNGYAEILKRLFNNKVIRTPYSSPSIVFFERLDGRYPISNDYSTLGKLSSFHLAKELAQLGYNVDIFSNIASEFKYMKVNFYGLGLDLLEAYSAGKKYDYAFVTGWTSLFEKLQKNNDVLPMIVMRSLKLDALTERRVKRLSRFQGRVILVSEESRKQISMLLPEEKTLGYRIIRNGYDPDAFFYERVDLIKKQVLFVGAFIEEKGSTALIEIAKRLPEIQFVVLGSSKMYGREDGYIELPKNLILKGEVTQEVVAKYYKESLVTLSLIEEKNLFETFGKSMMESQLCGCPVIGVMNGGLKSTILNNRINVKLSSLNISRICNQILKKEKFFRDNKLRASLAKASRDVFSTWSESSLKYMISADEELIHSLGRIIKKSIHIDKFLYS